MEKATYRGFEFSWHEPPMTTGASQVSIAGTTNELIDALIDAAGERCSHIVTATDFIDALAQAEAFVDRLLGARLS